MAGMVDIENGGAFFESLADPRHERNRKHRLVGVIVVAVVGTLCGAAGPTAIRRIAVHRREWLGGFLSLADGIPSRDGIRRVLVHVEPAAFQKRFGLRSAQAFAQRPPGQQRLIGTAGKPCRRSHDAGTGLGAPHIVSAWAGEEGLAPGRVAGAAKSDEIAATPLLPEQVAAKDALTTIDAMGGQGEIAEAVVAKGGDFVLAVTGNQKTLYDAVERQFLASCEGDVEGLKYRDFETEEQGHGRLDERMYRTVPVAADWPLEEERPGIKGIGQAIRVSRDAAGVETDEVRYYVVSCTLGPKRFGEAVRGHRPIESMPWVLDVASREDDSRTRERILGDNLSGLRRFAVSLLKKCPIKDSIVGKMTQCLLSTDVLTQVLAGK